MESRLAVSGWLRSRALDAREVSGWDLVRVSGPSEKVLEGPWGAIRLPGWPYLAVLPLVDSTGLLRSVLVRAVAPVDGPKSRALGGWERVGLVLADPVALALLRRSGAEAGEAPWEGRRVSWSGIVHICEGEPDFLTMAAHPGRLEVHTSGALRSYAVLAFVGSEGLPEDVAARIPKEAEVVIWPHQDRNGAGEKAADQIGRAHV